MRHPIDMGATEVKAFLSCLTNERHVSVSTHKQALCALLFLYKQVLATDFPWLDDIYRPNRPPRLPTVLTEWEVSAVFAEMKGTHALMARLMYGTGMRLIRSAIGKNCERKLATSRQFVVLAFLTILLRRL